MSDLEEPASEGGDNPGCVESSVDVGSTEIVTESQTADADPNSPEATAGDAESSELKAPGSIPKNFRQIEKEEEAKLKVKYPGIKGPSSSAFLQKRLSKGTKYFDSGDYNMAKAKAGPGGACGSVFRRPLPPGMDGRPGPQPGSNGHLSGASGQLRGVSGQLSEAGGVVPVVTDAEGREEDTDGSAVTLEGRLESAVEGNEEVEASENE